MLKQDAASSDLNIDAGTLYLDVSNNRVGVKTTAPEANLSVMGNLHVGLNTSVTGRGLVVSTSNGSVTDDVVTFNSQFSTGVLVFQTGGTERMRIQSDGKIGIGTTAPGEKLEVAGNVESEGLKLNVNTSMYTQNASLSYYSSTNAVYLNGPGNNGWLRLNASGTQNDGVAINLFGSAAGNLITLKTNTAERMRIDSAGRVGIGEAGMSSYDGDADDLVVKTAGNTGITVRTSSTGTGSIFFADGISGAERYQGTIRYFHNGNVMTFGTSASY